MESSIETSQTGGPSKPKPALAPKPRLTPKPFSLQKNTTIRSIHAPKTVNTTLKSTTTQTGKSEATGVPGPSLTTHDQKPLQQTTSSDSIPTSVSVHTKDKPKPTRESKTTPHEEDTLNSSVAPGKSDPPKPKPVQKDDIIQTNHKASTELVTNSEQKDRKKKEHETQASTNQKPEESRSDDSPADNPTYRWGSTRRGLPSELTSKFESGGPPVPPQPSIAAPTSNSKDVSNKLVSSDREQNQTTTELPNSQGDEGQMKEDYSGGGSIKRRISLLFDSSLRPEVTPKKEEPEIINSEGGVKERIKHWTAETSSEPQKIDTKPKVVPRPRSRSIELVTAPTAEKTTKTALVEPPANRASSTQAADPDSKVAPAAVPLVSPSSKDVPSEEKPPKTSTETQGEDKHNKSTEGEFQRRSSPSTTKTATGEGDSAPSEGGQSPLKRNNGKRRSVHFGFVERDDGGPPLILGSASESSSEEEEEEEEEVEETPEDKAEKDTSVSLPVYRRAGILQQRDDEIRKKQEEQVKHSQFEEKWRAEEKEQARLKLQEEHKREEEKARQREELRLREEEKQREKERERQRLMEEEMERQQKEEWEKQRLKEEEMHRQRQREEEMERERQMEAMWQRKREEDRERAKQKEERLKQDLREKEEEMERQREEERERAKQKEERLKQDLREKEEEMERQREEERERAKQKEERLKQDLREKEEEMERQREEERERAKQKDERLKQDLREKEEMERQRLREEEKLIHEQHRFEGKLREEEMTKEKQREEEWEKEWVKQTNSLTGEEERGRENDLDSLWYRQKEEEEERARQKEEEKLREEAMKIERERKRKLEVEERMREIQRQEEEERMELERKLQLEKEAEMERIGQIEKQREEERREEERKRQAEKEREEELERKKLKELERTRVKELEEKLRMDEEREREELDLALRKRESAVDEAGSSLISFDSEDAAQRLETPCSPFAKISEIRDSQIEVAYDDFSVSKKSLIDVDFDDFSVKPKRWGSQAKPESSVKAETSAIVQNRSDSPVGNKEAEELVPLNMWSQGNEAPYSPEPPPAVDSPEEEEEEERPETGQLISVEVEDEEETRETEEEVHETEEKDKEETQINSYIINREDKDTDALVDSEPAQQNEDHEQTPDTDSPEHISDQVPEVSSHDVDITDFLREPELAPFPESSTPLLDTSAQRSKADVSKRRIRTRPPRILRAGPTQGETVDWRACDSTDGRKESSIQRDSDSEEEQPKPKIVCSPSTSQRVPIFPGLSPAALIAQLKRRTGGGGAEGEEPEEDKGREERTSQHEEIARSPSQLSQSPRSAAHLAGAARVLPPLGGMDKGATASPAWLKELKSKKRLSQHGSEA